MPDSIIQRLTKINMLNIIIASIVVVWTFATCKSIALKEEMTQTAQSTVNGLQNIMLMVLGYYLKSNVQKQQSDVEEKSVG